jgi:hypothetical protein
MHLDHLNLFIKFAAKELNMKTLPKIHFVGNSENKYHAFGHTNKKDIYVRVTERHPLDIMRTLAHELIHCSQKVSGDLAREDNANAMAGRLMRKFNNTYPQMFREKPITNIKEDGVPANAVGAGGMGPTAGPMQGYNPLLKLKPVKRQMTQPWDHQLKTNLNKYNYSMPNDTPKKLRDIIGREYKNEKRSDKR